MSGEVAGSGCAGTFRDALREIDELGLRGDPDAALAQLASLHMTVPSDAVGEQVALAEQAMLLGRLGGQAMVAREICDRALTGLEQADARGRVLLSRGRVSAGAERRRSYTAALTEFSMIDDERGRALALGELAFPYEDDDKVSHDYRARLGAEGLRLALSTGDPYAIAVCAGNLAACETFLGRSSALERWRQGADFMPADIDARAAPVVALNGANWALAAAGFGDYALASRVINERAALIQGRRWERTFAAVEAMIAWRRGELASAQEAAGRATRGASEDVNTALGTIVQVACAFEREARPGSTELESAVNTVLSASEQIGAFAMALRARIRAARREPNPARGLFTTLDRANQRGRRFGWEDLVMALAEIRPGRAQGALAELGDLWPAGARAEAARAYVDGLLASDAAMLETAGECFLALPEPISAGQAFHAAARVTSGTGRANRLRLRAVEVFQGCAADRSLAGVLRDGRMRRTPDIPRIPDSQRHAVHAGLTPREHEVALLAQKGLSAGEIAERLSIAEGTVRNHVLRIREKFGGVPKRKLGELLAPEVTD